MWNTVRTADDTERLLSEFAGFHDSCVTGLEYESGSGADVSGFDPKTYEARALSEPSVSFVIADVLKWRIV